MFTVIVTIYIYICTESCSNRGAREKGGTEACRTAVWPCPDRARRQRRYPTPLP